jgi:hypothetical protein
MTRLIDRRRRLVFETPLLIGKRPLVVLVEPWGLDLRPKGCRHSLTITWAQVWNRAAIIAAEQKRAERSKRGSMKGKVFAKGDEKS